MKNSIQLSLLSIISQYPDDLCGIQIEFDSTIGDISFDFIIKDGDESITGGFFSKTHFLNENLLKTQSLFVLSKVFFFDGDKFILITDENLEDEFDFFWIFNNSNYSLIHLLSDYFKKSKHNLFYVHNNRIEDFAFQMNFDFNNFYKSVCDSISSQKRKKSFINSKEMRPILIEQLEFNLSYYFEQFYVEGISIHFDQDDKADFNEYYVPYINLEVIKYKELLATEIVKFENN